MNEDSEPNNQHPAPVSESDQRAVVLVDGRQTLAPKLKSLLQKSADISAAASKKAFHVTRKFIEKKREEIEERERQRKLALFDSFVAFLESHRNVINPATLKKISEYADKTQRDPDALAAFVNDPLSIKLRGYVETRKEFHVKDIAGLRKQATFEIQANELFDLLGKAEVDATLVGIAKKYKASNTGNIIAAGIFAGTRRGAGTALAMSNAAQVGHYNGQVNAAFTNNIRFVSFSVAGPDITESHQRAIVFAKRLRFFNIGEPETVRKALFSLIYNNGNAIPKSPTNDQFSGALAPEFHNNFRHQIWTVAQAVTALKELYDGKPYRMQLFSTNDVSSYMRDWNDDLPVAGFHVTQMEKRLTHRVKKLVENIKVRQHRQPE